MTAIIELLQENEIEEFSRLVDFVFDEYVGNDYSDAGNKTFKDYTSKEAVLERMKSSSIFYIAKDEGWIIGALEIRNKDHISLFFIDKKYQGKGIGRELFNRYISDITSEGITSVSVNSSIFGENIYTALGFKRTDGPREKDGILFIPMKYTL
jgi:GNAT superfamily N-acetyltransferase